MPIALLKMGVYNTFTDSEMIAEGGSILDTMEKNKPITELIPLVGDTRGKYKTYADAYGESTGRATVAIVKKRAAKSVLVDAFIRLAIGANFYADGNAEVLALTGMPMEKQPAARVKSVLEKPHGLSAVNCGNSGCVKVSVAKAVNAKSFVYQYTLDPVTDSSIWTSDGGKRRTFTWEGLKPGTIVWFRVIAVGTGNQRLVSDAVSCMVL